MTPLVSVCIPAYNAAKYIEETLTSISSQTWHNLEIIVGDNASTDNTKDIVESYKLKYEPKIKYYKNERNLGYSGNCNKLIEQAKGEYICIFHADDIYEPNLIEKQVDVLRSQGEVDAVFCLSNEFTHKVSLETNNINPEPSIINLHNYLHSLVNLNKSILVCPSSMVRASVYKKLSGYDTTIKYIEDVDMWIRILQQGRIAILNEKLINYRISANQGSAYYTSTERTELRPAIPYLQSFFKKDSSFFTLYGKGLSDLEAVDYIFLAKNCAIKCKYKQYSDLIYNSRISAKLGVKYWKFAIVQHLPIFLSYKLLKVIY